MNYPQQSRATRYLVVSSPGKRESRLDPRSNRDQGEDLALFYFSVCERFLH